MYLMLKGQAMADTLLPDTRQQCSEWKSLIPAVVTTEKRQSKQHKTQSRMVQASSEPGWGQALALQELFSTLDIYQR